MKIEEAIQQSKPFNTPLEKVVVNLAYTTNWVSVNSNGCLTDFGLSMQQYNILRILRGQGSNGVTVKFLIERMLDKNSNASRLVDKLVLKEYVIRVQSEVDRRRVDVFITDKGLAVLKEATQQIELGMEGIRNLSDQEYNTLSDLLDKMRG